MEQTQGITRTNNTEAPTMLWSLKQWKQLMDSSQESN